MDLARENYYKKQGQGKFNPRQRGDSLGQYEIRTSEDLRRDALEFERLKNIQKSLINMVHGAGEIVVKIRNEALDSKGRASNKNVFSVSYKDETVGRSVVSQADLRSEEYILEKIRKNFSNVYILSEESAPDVKSELFEGNGFIIDPIDGSGNFINGIDYCFIVIAYAEKGDVLTSVVYNPFKKETFTAIKDHGAFLQFEKNGEKFEKSLHCKDAIECIMPIFGAYYDRKSRKSINDFNDSLMEWKPKVLSLNIFTKRSGGITTEWKAKEGCSIDVRRFGSGAGNIAEVAAGRFDCFFEHTAKPWDVAASILIAREAGAIVTHYLPSKNDVPRCMDPYGIFVGTPFTHNRFANFFHKAFLPYWRENYPNLSDEDLWVLSVKRWYDTL
ncbi:MAG: inositol monophosphatase family protein [Bdellovibrionota bacterium]